MPDILISAVRIAFAFVSPLLTMLAKSTKSCAVEISYTLLLFLEIATAEKGIQQKYNISIVADTNNDNIFLLIIFLPFQNRPTCFLRKRAGLFKFYFTNPIKPVSLSKDQIH